MVQTTLKVDGMMCGMCESHINDAVRNAFPVRKVTSSHSRGQTVILSETASRNFEMGMEQQQGQTESLKR